MKLTVERICRIAMFAAMMVAMKEALAFIPNGELVTSIITVGTIVFGPEMILSTVVFSLLEISIYGLGLWTVQYLLVWPILSLTVMLFKKFIGSNRVFWTSFMAVFGLLFGTLCSIPYWFTFGPGYAIAWIGSGLSFDIMHCCWNAVFGFICYPIFMKIFMKLKMDTAIRSYTHSYF